MSAVTLKPQKEKYMKNNYNFLGIAVLFMVIIFFGLGCSKAAPASDFQFEVVGNGVKITRYIGDGAGGKLIIPGKINGMPVTIIGSKAFNNNKTLVSVTIPDSVTEIEDGSWRNYTGAFYGSSISSVTFSKNLKRIGDCAFLNCQNLPSINIPNSVTEIGERAFQGCENLSSVSISSSIIEIERYAFENNLNEESRKAIQATGYIFVD